MIEISSVNSSVSSPVSAKPVTPAPVKVSSDAARQAMAQQAKVSEESIRQAVQQANIEIAGGNEKVGFGYEETAVTTALVTPVLTVP